VILKRTDQRPRPFAILATALLAVVVIALAFWLGGNLGAIVVILAVVGLVAYFFYRSDRERPVEPVSDRTAAAEGDSAADFVGDRNNRNRLLVAVGATVSDSAEIPQEARLLIDAADEIRVMAPTLPTRMQWLTSATDKAQEKADERLQAAMGHLDDMGADPSGTVGADDPLLAFEDAIREFSPDHLLIALRSGGRTDWQERGLLDDIQERFGIPTTVFEFDERATLPE
jgi:hypothetical protein